MMATGTESAPERNKLVTATVDWMARSALRLGTGWGVALGFVLAVVIAFVDALTAPGLVFLMPLALAVVGIAWLSTTPAWLFTVVFGSAAWSIANLVGRPAVPLSGELLALATRVLVLLVLGFFAHELRHAVEHERELAVRDPLTGLLNRRGFFELAERELARSRREGTPITFAEFDLDGFKRVNDEYGHQVGDRVLVDFATRLDARLRATDVFGRVGGDEFALVLPLDRQAAQEVLDALAELPRDPQLPSVGYSVGFTSFDEAPPSLDEALGEADERMYEVKAGKPSARRPLGDAKLAEGPELGKDDR